MMTLMYQFNAAKENARTIRARINPNIQSLDAILEVCSKQTCCVFWFVGKNDLTEGSLDLLYSSKRKRVAKLLEKGCEVYLTDLMAWKAFEEKIDPINCKSQFESVICSLRESGVAYLASNCFFQKLFAINNPVIMDWINQICKREALYLPSQEVRDNGRRLFDLLEDKALPPILQIIDWSDRPLSQLYSVFQYIEIFFYIEDIIKDQLARSSLSSFDQGLSLNIQFVLPSDEYRYYLNDPNNIEVSNAQFEEDLKTFLKLRGVDIKIKSLEILIECFSFLANKKARPYNSGAIVSQKEGEAKLLSVINQSIDKRMAGKI